MRTRLLIFAIILPLWIWASPVATVPLAKMGAHYQPSANLTFTVEGITPLTSTSATPYIPLHPQSLPSEGCKTSATNYNIRYTNTSAGSVFSGSNFRHTGQTQSNTGGGGVSVPLTKVDGSHSIAGISAQPYTVAATITAPAMRRENSMPPPPGSNPDAGKQLGTPIGDLPIAFMVILAALWVVKRRTQSKRLQDNPLYSR